MFNKKIIAGWVYWSNDQTSGVAYQPGAIKNNLDDPFVFDAYMSINGGPKEGAGRKDPQTGQYKKRVKRNSPLKMDNYGNRVPQGTTVKEAVLIFVFDEMPSKNGIEGIKIAPGESGGAPHHVEFRKVGTTYQARLHYKFSTGNNKWLKLMEDVDPNVDHPVGG